MKYRVVEEERDKEEELRKLKDMYEGLQERLDKIEQEEEEGRISKRGLGKLTESTDADEIDDYEVLLEDEFSEIKEVCNEKNKCTVERFELEKVVIEL